MIDSPERQPGCDEASTRRTLSLLLSHGTAFNQFAHACLLASAAGELEIDALCDALDPLLAAAGARSAEQAAPWLGPDDRDALWLQQWLQAAQALGVLEADKVTDADTQAVADQVLEWRQAIGECQVHWRGLGQGARNEFKRRLQNDADQVFGLMQLYRVWVQAYEACYLRMLRKPAFLRDHARLLNAAIALGNLYRGRYRDWGRRLGLPDPEELDRLAEELQRLRRQVRNAGPERP